MKKSILFTFVLCLLSQWSVAQAPKWVEKAKRSVFSIVTYDKDDKIQNTGNGFFVTEDGVALSDYSLFKGAQRAVIINSEGEKMPVECILGANDMYDIIKFRVGITVKKVPALQVAALAPAVGAEVYLLPYSTQKGGNVTRGKVKKVDNIGGDKYHYYTLDMVLKDKMVSCPVTTADGKVKKVDNIGGDKYHYYTLDMVLKDKMVSCPVTTADGKVFGVAQKSSGQDTASISYAAGAAFAMSQNISALALSDPALNAIGIKKGLPEDEDQALVYLFIASTQSTPEAYAIALDDFIKTFPNSADGYLRRAGNYVFADKDENHMDKAAADLEHALKVAQKKDDTYYNIAKLIYNYQLSKPETVYKDWTYDKALENVRSAIAIQSLPVYQQLEGDILFAKQDYAGAFASYDKVNQTELASPASFFSAAKAKELSKAAPEEVIALLDSCIARCQTPITSDLAPYLLERAQMYMNVEKYRLALADYDAYFNAVKGSVNDLFYYYREQAAFKAKQFQRALDDIAKAIELNPEDLTYRAEQAVVNLRVGRYEEAEKVLKDALAIDPKYAEGYRLLGICQIQLKQEKAACASFAKAKELGDPNVDELIKKHCK